MFATVVRCSIPGCGEPADRKIAAAWSYDRFSELKTFGFACSEHVPDALERAERRPKPRHLALGEQVGPIGSYPLGNP